MTVTIDRDTGEIAAKHGEEAIDPGELGRIAAHVRQTSHDSEDS